MSSFNITTPETSLRLKPSSVAEGKTASGSATYSVTNMSGSTKRMRLRIDPGENAAQEWFTVRGGEERDIEPGATESFSVDVVAPGSAAPQDYSFTAVAVNLDDLDNDFERGAAIAFAAPAIEADGGSKVKWWMIAIPIAAVVLIGGGILTYILMKPNGEPFPVADVVDMPLGDAVTTIEGQGLKVREDFVGETEEPESDEGLVKVVKDQEPEAGEEIKPKKTVTLSWDWVSEEGGPVTPVAGEVPFHTLVQTDKIISPDEFSEYGLSRITAAPSGPYCADAVAAVTTKYKPGLTTATQSDLNRCNTVPVAIEFTAPVESVSLSFYGSVSEYWMKAYDASGTQVGSATQNGVLIYNEAPPAVISLSSTSKNISKIVFGLDTSGTRVHSLQFE